MAEAPISKTISITPPPQKIGIDKELVPVYQALRSGQGEFHDSPFITLQLSHIFLLAMSIGAVRGKRKPLKNRIGKITQQDLKNTEGEALIFILAVVEENTISILNDQTKVYTIAEEYANGGIEVLLNQIRSISNFHLEFEDLWRIYFQDTLKLNLKTLDR